MTPFDVNHLARLLKQAHLMKRPQKTQSISPDTNRHELKVDINNDSMKWHESLQVTMGNPKLMTDVREKFHNAESTRETQNQLTDVYGWSFHAADSIECVTLCQIFLTVSSEVCHCVSPGIIGWLIYSC